MNRKRKKIDEIVCIFIYAVLRDIYIRKWKC